MMLNHYKVDRGCILSGPGLSIIRNFTWEQERFAKTVTNNLPLLSVLGVRSDLSCGRLKS
jgi:hypothetical protein